MDRSNSMKEILHLKNLSKILITVWERLMVESLRFPLSLLCETLYGEESKIALLRLRYRVTSLIIHEMFIDFCTIGHSSIKQP